VDSLADYSLDSVTASLQLLQARTVGEANDYKHGKTQLQMVDNNFIILG